jgi:hypothetical protein
MPTISFTDEQFRFLQIAVPIGLALIPLTQLIFNVIQFFTQRARPALSYKIHSFPLLSVEPSEARLELTVNGRAAKNVAVVVVSLTNTGRRRLPLMTIRTKSLYKLR